MGDIIDFINSCKQREEAKFNGESIDKIIEQINSCGQKVENKFEEEATNSKAVKLSAVVGKLVTAAEMLSEVQRGERNEQ